MDNLEVGQLVLVGDAEDLSKRVAYSLGRIHCIDPETRKGREIVKCATVPVLAKNPDTSVKIIKNNLLCFLTSDGRPNFKSLFVHLCLINYWISQSYDLN